MHQLLLVDPSVCVRLLQHLGRSRLPRQLLLACTREEAHESSDDAAVS